MLENLLEQYDNFGRPKDLFDIIRLTGQVRSIRQSDFAKIGIPKGAIELLTSISLLNLVDGRLRLNQRIAESEILWITITRIFENLREANLLHNFLNEGNVFWDSSSSRISVRNYKIHPSFSNLRNFLITSGFFVKNEVIDFEFYIHPEYQNWFLSEVISDIENSQLGKNSIQDLYSQRAWKEKLGREAEEFVLNFERRERENHPKVENIQIISDRDTRAGYDIMSYSSDDALLLDKFIEVKSYSESPYFFWSNNEAQIAKKKGANYFLYLVDRNRMDEKNYRPMQIANPNETVLKNPTCWGVRGDGYFIKKID